MALFSTKKNSPEDGQMELVEHLAELRTRIFRSLIYVGVGMILTYNLLPWILAILKYPMEPILESMHANLVVANISSGFFLWMQVCFIAGLVVAVPLVVLELWGFIKPALTPEERKPVTFLAPFSVLLFLAGACTGYASLPSAYGWMASFIVDLSGVQLFQNLQDYILLTLKIILAFGISFELPVVLLFLGRIGVLNAKIMTTYWRHAVVIIATAAAILTPSNDPATMLMMAIPMAGLYLLSISLVRVFEPRSDGTKPKSFATMLGVSLAPVVILMAVGYWLWRTRHPLENKHLAGLQQDLQKQGNATPEPGASPIPGATPGPDASPAPSVTDRLDTQEKRIDALSEEIRLLREQLAPSPAPIPATPNPDTTSTTTFSPAPPTSPLTSPAAQPTPHNPEGGAPGKGENPNGAKTGRG